MAKSYLRAYLKTPKPKEWKYWLAGGAEAMQMGVCYQSGTGGSAFYFKTKALQ